MNPEISQQPLPPVQSPIQPEQKPPGTGISRRTIVIIIVSALIPIVIAILIIVVALPKMQNKPTNSQVEQVIDPYGAVSRRARDTERKTSIQAIHAQLEAFYARYGGYPTINDLNNSSWRSTNGIVLSETSLADPLLRDKSVLADSPRKNAYSYEVSPAGCVSPRDTQTTNLCSSYTLTATLETLYEGSYQYQKTAIN